MDKALNECFQFGSIGSYIKLLYIFKDKLNNEDLFSRFIRIEDTDLIRRHAGGSFSYELEKMLDRLQETYINDADKAQSIGRIEFIFAELLDWGNMKFFQKVVRTDPALYAQMNEIVFKKDEDYEDHKQSDEERDKYVSHIYKLYQKAEFCPTEKDGNVS